MAPNTRKRLTMPLILKDAATTVIYTLSLHDALPISFPVGPTARDEFQPRRPAPSALRDCVPPRPSRCRPRECGPGDRKSTRLNSSHPSISYAVFCLKKKNYSRIRMGCLHAEDSSQTN